MAAKPNPTIFFNSFESFVIFKPGEVMHVGDDQKIRKMMYVDLEMQAVMCGFGALIFNFS
jgi:FMN phosphatase YigB (HAD superfamily)